LKISENAQEQLELLWIASEEDQAQQSVDPQSPGDYQELIQLGLVVADGDQPRLTEIGKSEAAMAIRRHRLAERMLSDILTTESALIDDRACSLEHALFDGVDESICTLLGHPTVCPHGKPIPPGRCCEQLRTTINPLIAPLKELKRGQSGKIAYLHMNNPHQLRKLMAMGVLPGVSIRVKEIYPSYVFEAGYSQFAVDEEIAADIYVRLAPPT
jgi:DtxR family transcriptional regulator, Mn-dependent transcriptional regulator